MRRTIRRAPVSSLFRWGLLLSLLFSVPSVVPAQAAGMLSLTRDTVWSGSIDLVDEVYVRPGVTLLVLPGTTVRFAKASGAGEQTGLRLIVRGTLIAQGRPDAPIVFTSSEAIPRPGDWSGILLDNSKERTNRLSHCRIEYAHAGIQARIADLWVEDTELVHNRTGFQGKRQLEGGLFRALVSGNGTGIHLRRSSGLRVEASRIENNREAGVVLSVGSSAELVGNEITDNGTQGIACYQGSSPTIRANRIRGHRRGIYLELKSNPEIVQNEISENETGIWAEKLVSPKIVDNRITGNGVGIYCNYSAYPELRRNLLVDNSRFALVLGDNQSIVVERKIPFRTRGRNFDTPQPPAPLPAKARKPEFATIPDDGLVHAEENWWGSSTTAEMTRVGPHGNVAVIEDALDKPDVEYEGHGYPRDRVTFAPWLETPPQTPEWVGTVVSGVRGKVVFDGMPTADVRVHVYDTSQGAFRGAGISFSAPTGADGTFRLDLPPGRYYLVAKEAGDFLPGHEPEVGQRFGYYGGNPVLVARGEPRSITLSVVRRAPVSSGPGDAGSEAVLQGVVRTPLGPVAGALVHLYPDASRDFRGPDLFGPEGAVLGGTESDGTFSVEAPPGRYYVVASKRVGGQPVGPIAVGDAHGYFDGNPLLLDPGSRTRIVVQVAVKQHAAEPSDRQTGGLVGIRGRIAGAGGGVPRDAYAYASTQPNLMGGMMPPFRSRSVGPDGVYFIDVPAVGTYYVGARSGYGGPPLPGEWFGIYGGENPAAVTLERPEVVDGVDIVIRRLE